MAILTTKTVLAGHAGTKQLTKIYGERLIAVRYKLDIEHRRKMKTAEIIVDEWEWKPVKTPPVNKVVRLKVKYGEKHLGVLVRNAGGKWNREGKYWELPYGVAVRLGLEERILDEG